MKYTARTMKNTILYILIALMVVTGTLSGESRVQSELLTVAERAGCSIPHSTEYAALR